MGLLNVLFCFARLVPTTVWLDHGALKRLVYQMANFHHASDERIYSRALQALVRLLKAGRDVASADFIKAVILAISGEGLNHIGVYRMLAALINRPEVKQVRGDNGDQPLCSLNLHYWHELGLVR